MGRTAASAGALCVLVVSAGVAFFALYLSTDAGSSLSGAVSALQLALALVAVGVAWLGQLAALRGPVPERSWILLAAVVVLDVAWWTLVSRAGEGL